MSLIAKEPFHFYTRQNLTYLTGRKAKNLKELLDGIREAPSATIYHHTHHYLQQHEFLSPEPPNDFAYWITNVLQDDVLGERIASIDLRQYFRLHDIRSKSIAVIKESIQQNSDPNRNVPLGAEFHFMRAQTFVFPTKYIAHNLAEFKECLQRVSIFSIYYHMFESRLRLQQEQCDFSFWVNNALGEEELARAIIKLDPYTRTLENLRLALVRLVERRLSEDIYGTTQRL
jgi:hypothetical protein